MRTLAAVVITGFLCSSAWAQFTSVPIPQPRAARPISVEQQRANQLFTAVAFQREQQVRALIGTGMKLDVSFDDGERDYPGESPLTMAINRGFVDMARILLEAGASVHHVDGYGHRAIHVAHSADAIRLLVRYGADLNVADRDGFTPLATAVRRSDREAVDGLVASGARLDATDLFAIAAEAKKPELIAHLVQRGIDPRRPPTRALWVLVDDGDVASAKLLIERGAKVDLHDDREWLLARTLGRRQWEIARAMMDAGAEVRLREPKCTRLGRCDSILPVQYASFDPPTLAALKQRGADLDATGADGHTALTAIIWEIPRAIRAVSTGPARAVATTDGAGRRTTIGAQPPLRKLERPAPDNAVRVRTLLAAGADPNRKYGEYTPLMLAIALRGRAPGILDAVFDAGGRVEFDRVVLASGPVNPHIEGPADYVAPDNAGRTVENDRGTLRGMRMGPLTWLALQNRPDIALRVLARERKVEASDESLLYFTAELKQWGLLTAAIPYTNAVDAANRAGVTPLMLAAEAGNADAVRALIAAGAAVNARTVRSWSVELHRSQPHLVGGYTALRIAKAREHAEIAAMLAAAGGTD